VIFWPAVIASGVLTYLTRSLPLAVALRGTAPRALRRYLDALPIAIIAALAGAGVAVPNGAPTGGAEVAGAIAAAALGAWRRNLLVAVLGGVAVVAALRAIGL
jgi:branched-subunit amino acid transport protein